MRTPEEDDLVLTFNQLYPPNETEVNGFAEYYRPVVRRWWMAGIMYERKRFHKNLRSRHVDQ